MKGEKLCMMVFIALVVSIIVGLMMQPNCPNTFVVGGGGCTGDPEAEGKARSAQVAEWQEQAPREE